jgi:putative cell division protein ftsI
MEKKSGIKKGKKVRISAFKLRMAIISAGVVLAFFGIFLRLFFLQVVKGEEYKKTGEEQYRSNYTIPAKRGRIISNDGEILAFDGEDYVITLDPTLVKDENIDKLMDLFKKNLPDLDTDKVKRDIILKKNSKSKYLKVNYKLGYNERKAIEDEMAAAKYLSSGVFFKPSFSRNYIKNEIFQEMIGFLDSEGKGAYGIEKFYDEALTGTDGVVEGMRNPGNFLTVDAIKNKKSVSVQNGNNIILTIDSILQDTMDAELKRAFEKYSAASTMGILMEVETGRILAMSSYPKASNNAEVKNRPITDMFEPGSIFKPVTVAMGLDTGVITPNSTLYSAGHIKVYDRIIKDSSEAPKGTKTIEDLVAYSGNVGMVVIGSRIDAKVFHNYLDRVGMGKKTGIDTFAEMSPKLLSLKDLTAVRKSNVSFGQGIAMTQIQMITSINAVVNNGKLMKPYLVDRLEDDRGNIIKQNSPVVVRKVFEDDTSRRVRQYMEAVVTKGTGKGAQIKGYRIGGKTGTAQKSGLKGYDNRKYFSSFIAFFPVDNPKYIILISINEPKVGGKHHGSEVALPSVRNVLEKLIKYMGISPEGNIEESRKEKAVEQKPMKDLKKLLNEFNNNKMPDLTGLSLREIISIYPQIKFPKYKITGNGSVVEQYPSPGTKLDKNSEVRIILN